jgi:hypothetical protein
MPPLIPDSVPTHFAQGTTVKYTRSLADFAPSDGWQYTLYMNGLTQKLYQAASKFDAATFLVEIDAASNTLTPGAYRYAERLTNPGTQFVLTGVTTDGEGNAIYAFSGYSDLPPYIGMPVTVAGFTNSGNNVSTPTAIEAMEFEGDDSGTFTIANSSAVDETHGATAAGAQQTYDITGDTLVITVEPSVASSAAGTFQTQQEKMLAAIDALITNRMTGAGYSADIDSYHIAGRAVSKMSLPELLKLRGMLASAVWQQQHPGRLSKPWRVRFPSESEQTNLPPTWQDVTGLDFGEG